MDSSRLPSSPPSSPPSDATPGGGGLQPSAQSKANMSIVPSSNGVFSPFKPVDDSLRSDNIGGPEDFTIHLVDYMTGKRTHEPNPRDRSSRAFLTGTPAVPDHQSLHRDFDAESSRAILTGTPAVPDYQSSRREFDAESSPSSLVRSAGNSSRLRTRIACSSSPPRERSAPDAVAFMRSHIDRLEEDLVAERKDKESDAAAYAVATERFKAAHREELRAASDELRTAKEAQEEKIRSITAQYQQLKLAFEEERRRHQKELEDLRAEHARELRASKEEIAELKAVSATALASQEKKHAAEIQQLQTTQAPLEKPDLEETIFVEQERVKHMQDLDRIEAQHDKQLEMATEEIKDLKAQLASEAQGTPTSEREMRATSEELKRVKKVTTEHLKTAAEEIARLKAEVSSQDQLRKQLSQATEGIEALKMQAEERAPNVQRISSLQDEILELRLQLAARDQRIIELETVLRAQSEQSQKKSQPPSRNDSSQQLAAELAARTADFDRINGRLDDLERLNARYIKQLQTASQTADTVKAAHTAGLEHIAAQTSQRVRSASRARSEELDRLRQLVDALRSENQSLKAAHATELDALSSARSQQVQESKDLRVQITKLEALNRDIGHQLLRAWGREEFGDTGERQKYRYKYVKA